MTATRTDVMTIRQMCETYDVTPRTLRFYEQKELLSPIREGTKRLFTRRDRGRLQLILRGKRFGFSLESIRQLLDLYEVDPSRVTQLREAISLGGVRLDEMRAQRDELTAAITDLEGQMDQARDMLAKREAGEAAA